ncbi:diguanylate cyclase [Thiotrichales bacterium 19S3-7]|nr:diguanylate cyclase [Thiotrichales bacterium 19S3-7]MCF6802592.1 diguanylate cyclase [Thiotrichales bacterium 19S3-11]
MKKEILAISSEVDLLGEIKKALSPSGWQLLFASDEKSALNISKERTISVVIIDFNVNSINMMQTLKIILPYSVQILMLDESDITAVFSLLLEGEVYRFVKKPLKHHFYDTVTYAMEEAIGYRHRRLLDRAFLSCVEAIFYTAEDGFIEWINPAVTQILGYQRREVVGKHIAQFDINEPAMKRIRFHILKTLKQYGRWQGYYWVVGASGEHIPISMSINLVTLESGERCYVYSILDNTEEHQYRQFIEHQAYYDHLTGLANRWLFGDRVEQAVSQGQRNRWQVVVFFMDLDNFKPVNDRYGHHMGDLLLQQVAARLKSFAQVNDTVARFAGDEFAILIPKFDSEKTSIDQFAQCLLDAFSEPFEVNSYVFDITLSVGIATYPQTASNATELVRFADLAMYQVKNKGRSGYHIYQLVDEVI